ncbi:aminoglycoside phosphotransferase family enzyme [Pedobacter sp. CG_S7]|uniref:hypothetical protein n=1 Tax=Pedobacter sp. CG_S7 TaxID=3143930 RepID=UPI003396D962
MEQREIDKLIKCKDLQEPEHQPILVETHISWVILAGNYAYKIKKPVKFSFLDFSTLEKRGYYCDREVLLNKRLAAEMYLRTIPIFKRDREISFSNQDGVLIDYAVLMMRMDTNMEMDKLLLNDQISEVAIEKLAIKIAEFHRQAKVIDHHSPIESLKNRFNDIEDIAANVLHHLGDTFTSIIQESVKISNYFLDKYQDIFAERTLNGFVRDVHGDLHTGNIFLYPDPVVFDCIEFNDELRQMDVLDEIAFLCMDLDAYSRSDLSEYFYKKYVHYSGIKENNKARLLFDYYKFYRANVRAKVYMLNAGKTKNQLLMEQQIIPATRYLNLLGKYMVNLAVLNDRNHQEG